ncbi:AraC family transcriptional regulator [Flavitalea sp. BT771]|uniref:helix-turn-helix domain-containing protein n=1 Tax=Flavitalea sp. BT771 TaxID=3063329 RepID=UPI0026E38F30|nr:AraC family transcriptional regulator [Flavitalea sp. BT771]MDO6432631.1 AraC family transcriptional regulator [Flavitalea sp. BT771]MDV6222093.1 AraC family transcriptional regulator [Flavitalea sp. BT771]
MPTKIFGHNVKKLSYSVNAKQYSFAGHRVTVPLNRNRWYKIWLIGNPCRLVINDELIVCKHPVLFFANPLVSYAYDSLQDKRWGYWCVFTREFLAVNDTLGRFRAYPELAPASTMLLFPEPEQLAVVKMLFEQLTVAVNARFAFSNEMIFNYIQLLIFEAMKGGTQSAPAGHPDAAVRITRQFLQLLEEQFPIQSPDQPMQLRTPADFARRLAIHVNHLNTTIRNMTGQTTTQHIAAAKIAEAKALLRHSNFTIGAIGEGLGFNCPNHFFRFFKQNSGLTPLAYRTKANSLI